MNQQEINEVVNTLDKMKKIEEKEKSEIEEKEKSENQEKGIFKIQTETEIEISEDDFKEYESCRLSGLTNMFNLNNVELITGLDKDKIKVIIKNYTFLLNKYGGLD